MKDPQSLTITGNRFSATVHHKNTRSQLRQTGRVILFLFVLFYTVITSGKLYSDNSIRLYARDYDFSYNQINERLFFDIESYSGTPPILEFVLGDSKKIVRRISFDFEGDGEIDLSVENREKEVVFRGVPYRENGDYRPKVFIETLRGTFMREYSVSFTDFVWGRDNFNFANDAKFENRIDPVSKSVTDWAAQRFGSLSQDQQLLLIYLMYRIFTGSIGRCYAFSGGEVEYLKAPGKLPSYSLSTYWIDEADREFTRQMDYFQNDLVFSNFISGRINLEKDQDSENLKEELFSIRESINAGKPIILGYLSNKMHHSLLVYGYFYNPFRSKTTLLVANNWERDQNINSFSEDAENIVIRLDKDTPVINWYDLTKRRHRYPKRLFGIEMEEKYKMNPEDFFDLLKKIEEEIIEKNNTIVIVEETEEALLVNGEGKKRGYSKPSYLKEFDIPFKKIDYNYLFEVPKDGTYRLTLNKRRYNKEKDQHKEVNLFFIIPEANGIRTEAFQAVSVDESSDTTAEIGPQGIEFVD